MMLSADSSFDTSLWWILIILAITALLLIQLRRHQFRGATARDLTREQFARLRDQRDIRQSMDQLLLQLEDLSRRINAQVDTKFLKLETVVRDADQRIARLEALLEQVDRTRARLVELADARDPRLPSPKTAKPAGASTPPAKETTASARSDHPPRSGASTGTAAPPVRRAPSPETERSPATSKPPTPHTEEVGPQSDSSDARVKRVYDLADEGKPPMHIAEDLNMPLGEIELILNLRSFR